MCHGPPRRGHLGSSAITPIRQTASFNYEIGGSWDVDTTADLIFEVASLTPIDESK